MLVQTGSVVLQFTSDFGDDRVQMLEVEILVNTVPT